MAGIGSRCPGASLVECVVASLILLISFALTMELLTKSAVSFPDAGEQLLVVQDIHQLWRELKHKNLESGKYRRDYNWGKLWIDMEEQGQGIIRLKLKVEWKQKDRPLIFRFLLKQERYEK